MIEAPQSSLRYLTVFINTEDVAWLHNQLTADKDDNWDLRKADSLEAAVQQIEEAGPIQVIFIDPLQGDPPATAEWILGIRKRHERIVFVFYTNVQEFEQQIDSLYPPTIAARFRRYYSLDRNLPPKQRAAVLDQRVKDSKALYRVFEQRVADQPRFTKGQFGNADIVLVHTQSPWLLDCDGLTLSVSPIGDLGQLAKGFVDYLPGKERGKLGTEIGALKQIDFDSPVVLGTYPMVDEQRSPLIIVATPGEGDALPEQNVIAMRAVVLKAAKEGVTTLMLPVIGTGTANGPLVNTLNLFLETEPVDTGNLKQILVPIQDREMFEKLSANERSNPANDPQISSPASSKYQLGQPSANDLVGGPDLLDISTEVYAIADAVAFDKTTPPLVVGILGGWGTGKSFAMNLLEERLREIRNYRLEKADAEGEDAGEAADRAFPYVGHLYQVKFDAWTYAKSNLWASLMHTIFTELDWQLSLESKLWDILTPENSDEAAKQKIELDGLDLWAFLGDASKSKIESRKKIESRLGEKELLQLLGKGEPIDADILWQQLRQAKVSVYQEVAKQQSDLAEKRADYEVNRARIEEQLQARAVAKVRSKALGNFALKELDGFLGKALEKKIQKHKKGEADASEDTDAAAGETGEEQQENKKKATEKEETLPPIETLLAGVKHLRGLVCWGPLPFIGTLVVAIVIWALTQTIGFDNLIDKWDHWIQALLTLLPGAAYVLKSLSIANAWAAKTKKAFEQHCEAESKKINRAALLRDDKELQDQIKETLVELNEDNDPRKKIPEEIKISTLEDFDCRAQQRFKESETAIDSLLGDAGITSRCFSIHDFVRSKVDSEYYNSKLGILHQVQKDQQELTEALMEGVDAKGKKIFPRGQPRIFLFIDDLDRCPPDKVVEVLEAVQLLLNTKLFVVILGMDVRYVTRALEKKYKEILIPNGTPSGLDYIEKIIQIPYRVPPISDEAMEKYLRKLLDREKDTQPEAPKSKGDDKQKDPVVPISPPPPVPAIEDDTPSSPVDALDMSDVVKIGNQATLGFGVTIHAPETPAVVDKEKDRILISPELPPAEVQEVDEQELARLVKACQAAHVSPRAGKRLTNVFKLMKVIWERRNQKPSANAEQALVLLLALAAQHPDVMRDLLKALQATFDRSKTNQHLLKETLFAFLEKQLGDSAAKRSTREFMHII